MTVEAPAKKATADPGRPVVKRRRLTLVQRLKRDKVMLLLAGPGLLYFLVFHYLPMLGNVVAFQDYQPYLGFFNSEWIGLENFTDAFADARFWSAVTNTLVIALVQLVFFFPAPIALALLLNSVLSSKIRRFVQSVVYLPHFIGWVIIVSIFQQLLGAAGLLPNVLDAVGLPRYDMMTDPDAFPWLLTIQLVWKDMGWGTIIFLAALLAVDPQLYEAAAVDGASRWRRLWHVTLPGITPIIILLLILNLGSILSVGFEQLILQRDNVGAAAGEVLDTYVYFNGIQNGEWGPSAAIGIVKAVFGTAMILGANKLAHFFGHEGIYRGADK